MAGKPRGPLSEWGLRLGVTYTQTGVLAKGGGLRNLLRKLRSRFPQREWNYEKELLRFYMFPWCSANGEPA